MIKTLRSHVLLLYFYTFKNKMIPKFILPIFVLAVLSSCGNKENKNGVKVPKVPSKQIEKPQKKPGLLYPYELIKAKKKQHDDSFARLGDSMIICSYKGKIELADSTGNSREKIVDLRCEYLIDQAYILPRENNEWFMIWQETHHQGQRTNFAVFKKGTDKPEWKISFPYANLGPPVVDGEMCYFTIIGMVGKMNIGSGKVEWKKDSLYNPHTGKFKKFELPIVYPDKIVFVDLPVRGRKEKRDSLHLDPITGQQKK